MRRAAARRAIGGLLHGVRLHTKRTRLRPLCGAMALLLFAAPSHAAVVVTNHSVTASGNLVRVGIYANTTLWIANAFTTGSEDSTLNSVQIRLSNISGTPNSLEVFLRDASGNDITQLTGPSTPSAYSNPTYTCVSTGNACDLKASTTYQVRLNTPNPSHLGFSNNYILYLRSNSSESGPGVAYGWSIANNAFNHQGQQSGPIALAIDAQGAVPKAPANLRVDTGATELIASWNAPTGSVTDYDVRYSSNSGATWTEWEAGTTSTNTSTTITGLTNGTTYQVQVRAGNSSGDSAWTSSVSAIAGAPKMPQQPRAAPGNTQLAVSWEAPSGNGSSVSGYDVQYRQGSTGSWTDHTHSGTGTSATITGLTNSTAYWVQVRATNSRGDGPYSPPASATPTTSPAPTSADFTKIITASSGQRQHVLVSKFPYLDGGGSALLEAEIVSLPGSSVGKLQLRKCRRSLGSRCLGGYSYTDVRLGQKVPNEWYQIRRNQQVLVFQPTSNFTSATFRFKVVNFKQVASTSTYTATLSGVPAKPTGVSATAGNTQVALSWTSPNDLGISRWEYQQKAGVNPYGTWQSISGSAWDTTSYTVKGLTNSTEYKFKIRAVSVGGNGPASDEVTATPAAAAPATPSGLKAAVGNRQVTLTWDDPKDASITKYRVRRKAAGGTYGNWAEIGSSGATTTTQTVGGLTNGTEYTFQIQAQNATGNATSAEVSQTPNVVPSAPTGLAAAAGGGVRLTWTNPNNAAIGGYQYRQKAGGLGIYVYGSWTTISGGGATTTSYRVTGLTDGVEYTFQIRATNSAGASGPSAEASATPPGLPLKPTGLSAVPPLNGAARLTWNDPGDTSITKYKYRFKAQGDNYGSWLSAPNAGAKTTTYYLLSLVNDITYTLQIRAVNSVGDGPASDEVSVTPRGLPKKPSLSAEARDQGAELSWTIAGTGGGGGGGGGITQYQYQQKTTGDWGATWTDIANSGAATTSHTVTGLTNGTAYTFRVRARGTTGDGPASNEVSAMPAREPAAPTGLSASARHQAAELAWTDPNDSDITKYQYQQKTTGDWTSWTDIAGSGATTTSYRAFDLDNGTAYTFRIRAVGAAAGEASNEATATPVPRPGMPLAPSASPRDSAAVLTWANPHDGTITKYQYQQRTAGDWGSTWTDISNSGATTTTFKVEGLTNGTTYQFRIRAWNADPSPPSGQVGATPQPVPMAPTALRAEAGDRKVVLRWTRPVEESATVTKYQTRYKTTGDYGAWSDVTDSGFGTATATVSGLTNGTAHAFQVRAVNRYGDGAASAEASATPFGAPARPTGLAAHARNQAAVLTWTDPGNATITQWQYRWKTTGGYGAWGNAAGGGSAVRYEVTSLENGTQYTFQIRARNASGDSPESAEASAMPSAVPAKPTGLSAEVGNEQLLLSWDHPQNSTITKYQYRYKAAGSYGSWTDMAGSGSGTTSHTVGGLSNGTEYTLQIRSANAHGSSPESAEVSESPATVPRKPTGFAAAAGNMAAALSWDDPSDSTITQYQYRQKAGKGTYGSWTAMAGSGASTTSHTVGSLTNNAAYTFRIRALNATGRGTASDEASATPLGPPARPTGLRAAHGYKQVRLTWTDPGNATITKWEYQYKTGGGYGSWISISDSASTTGHTVKNLTNGTLYTFRIRALSRSGASSASPEVSATPSVLPPSKPTGLTAEAGSAKAYLKWNDPNDASITKWEYQYKTTSSYGAWTAMANSGATTTAYTATGLSNGTLHRFRIRAVGDGGNGAASDEASVTPAAVPDRPSGLSAAGGNGQVALSWTDPSDSAITGYEYRKKATGNYGAWTAIPNSGASTTNYTATGLSDGTTYAFQIRAANSTGSSAASAAASALTKPAQPAGFAAAPKSASAVLSWTDPRDASITQWQYRRKTGGSWGSWTAMTSTLCGGAVTTSCTIGGLTNNTAYAFQIRAVNATGEGPASDEAPATPIPVPAKPTGLSASTLLRDVTLNWANPSNASITQWQYRRKQGNNAYGSWTGIPGSGATTTSYEFQNLTSRTKYTFQIRAANPSGPGAASDELAAVPAPVPAQPTGISTAVGDGRVDLSWSDPSDISIVRYEYRRKKTSSTEYGNWTAIPDSAPDGANATGYAVTGLDNGSEYTFNLRAANLTGLSNSAVGIRATPKPVPAKPSGLSASVGDGRTVLSWSSPATPSYISKYQYQQKTTGDWSAVSGWTEMSGSGASTTSHAVEGLTNDTAHAFRIRAVNAAGEGAPSEEATVTPIAVPAKPTGLTATGGSGSAALSWTDPSDASITKHQYRQKEGSNDYGDWTEIPDSGYDGTNETGYTLTGLEASTTYKFKIRAWNAAGAGPESSSATALTAPAKPTGLSATGGSGQVALSWTDPSDGTITQYEYRQKEGTTGNYGNWTGIPDSAHDGDNATGYTVSTLSGSTTYTFKIRARNTSGAGAQSDEASALTAPAKPSGLSASGSDGKIALSWTDPNDSTITKHQYLQQEGSNDYGDWTDIPNSADDEDNAAGYTLTDLAASTTYKFKIRAWNTSGASTESAEVSAQTLPVPAKPTGLSKTLAEVFGEAGKFNMTLRWSNPNNATIDEYRYRLKEKQTGGSFRYGGWTKIEDSGASTVSWSLPNRSRNTLQFIQIRAVNGSGIGTASDEFPVRPAQASGLAAEGRDRGVELRWTNPNDSTITNYQYRKKAGEAVWEGWTDMSGSGAATVSYTVGSLVNEKTHKFRIRAVNPAGEGAESGEAAAIPAILPAAPPDLQATLAAATGTAYDLTLSWSTLSDPTVLRWEYQTQPVGGTYGNDWTHVAGGKTATALALNGQARNGLKKIRLRAVNLVGNGASGEVLLVPDAPTGLAAVARNQSADLSWTDPSHGLISKYQYRQKTGNAWGAWTDISGSDADTVSHTVDGLTNNSAYAFRIRAWNLAGESSASPDAEATPIPVPAKPTGLSASLAANGSNYNATLTWAKPSGLTVGQWQYQARTGSDYSAAAWAAISSSTASTTTSTLPAQARNTWKGIRIRVVNTGGQSPASEEVELMPPQPTGLAAVGKDRSADLSWTAPQFARIAGHQYQLKTTAGYGNWAAIPNSAPGEANVAGYTVGSLTNRTAHTFRIRAVNPAFDSTPSASASATPAPVPAKPVGVAASLAKSGSNYNLTLTWTNPRDDSITQWQYQTRIGSDYSSRVWTAASSSTASTTSLALSGQSRNTIKGIRIRAVNSTGDGAASAEVLLVPKKPADLAASTGNTEVLLQWTDPGHALISEYQYQKKEDGGNYGSWQDMDESDADTVSYTATGLTNNTAYTFRIRAASLAGESAESGEASATPVPVPAQPTGLSKTLTAAAGTAYDLTLRWTNPNNATISGYRYQLKNPAGNYGSWTNISNSGASTVSLSLRNRSRNTLQAIRIRAMNVVGEGPPSADMLLVPAKPGLRAEPENGRVALQWDDPNDSAIAGYEYRRKTTGGYGNWAAIPNSAPGEANATGYTVGSLTNRTTYAFQIRASNLAGNGLASNEASATPSAVPEKPTGLAVSLTANGSNYNLALTWTNPNDALLTGYEYQTRAGAEYGDAWTEISSSTASTTSLALSGQRKNAMQAIRIRAMNEVGASTPSDEALVMPVQPTGLAAAARATSTSSTFLDLAWDAANDSKITKWQYRMKIRVQDEYVSAWQDIPSSDAATTSYALPIDSYQNGYAVKIRAVSLAGDGIDSAEESGSLLPSAPTGLTGAVSGSHVALAWSNADAKRPAIKIYEYRVKAGDGAYSRWTDIPSSGMDTTAYTVTQNVGTAGTTYAFQVRGESNAGDGAASNEASVSTVPASPKNLHAALGNRSAVLTWADPGDSTITGYEYRQKAAFLRSNYGTWVPISGSGASTTSHTVTGLENGTAYLIILRARNAAGSGSGAGPALVTPAIVPTLALELSPAETRENAPATVTVTARIGNGPLSTATQVALSAAPGTAEAGDYVLPQTLPQISIAAGQTVGTATLSVTPTNDQKDEEDETFTISAEATSSVLGQRKLTDSATFTIIDDDEPPTLTLLLSSAEVPENGAAATVTVTAQLTGNVREPDMTIVVAVDDASSTATLGADADYTIAGLPATIAIAGGGSETSGMATVTVTPADDALSEMHETVVLAGTAAGLKAASTAFTIRDDEDPTLSLALSLSRIRENEGPMEVTVTAATNRAIEGAAAAVALSFGGTATQGEDYTLEPTPLPSIAIPENQNSGTVTVTMTPIQDNVIEGEETIVVTGAGEDLVDGTVAMIIWEYALEAEKKILTEALTEIVHGTLASARHVLSGRFRRPSNGNGNGAHVAGISTDLFESSDDPHATLPDEPGFSEDEAFRISSQAWWQDSAFEYRFQKRRRYFQEAHWSLWGQGDYMDFSGEIQGSGSYDGDVRSAYIGMDARIVDEWVAGLAVAHSRGRVDYRLDEAAGSISGLLKTELTSVYPYASVEWGNGFEAWAMLGAGQGDIELERRGESEKLESDLSMLMGAVGFRSELASGGANGPQYSLIADAAYAEFEIDDEGMPVIDNLTVDMHQVRAGLEYACSAVMNGGRWESYAQMFARYDGGDGIEGAGLELVGGLRFSNAAGWEVDAQGRWLAAHSEENYEEHGMSVALKKEWGKDRRGLYLLLVPQWGASPESAAAVWGGGAFEMQDMIEQDEPFSLKAEIGYGSFLPLLERQVAWFGEMECGGDRWRVRTGARFEAWQASNFKVEVFGAYEDNAGKSERSINVHSTLGY